MELHTFVKVKNIFIWVLHLTQVIALLIKATKVLATKARRALFTLKQTMNPHDAAPPDLCSGYLIRLFYLPSYTDGKYGA